MKSTIDSWEHKKKKKEKRRIDRIEVCYFIFGIYPKIMDADYCELTVYGIAESIGEEESEDSATLSC